MLAITPLAIKILITATALVPKQGSQVPDCQTIRELNRLFRFRAHVLPPKLLCVLDRQILPLLGRLIAFAWDDRKTISSSDQPLLE